MKRKTLIFSMLLACMLFPGCQKETPDENGEKNVDKLVAVDLGLSIKWANMDVDAADIYTPGKLFAWGETSSKSDFNKSNYSMNFKAEYSYSYKVGDKTYTQDVTEEVMNPYWTKDLNIPDYGTLVSTNFNPDYRKTLYRGLGINGKPEIVIRTDDAARKILGKDWRMPKDSEWKELFDKCKIEVTTLEAASMNSILKVTGPNGNHILISFSNSAGDYWSASLDKDNPVNAMKANLVRQLVSSDKRYRGAAIRAVYVGKEESTDNDE